MAERVPAGLTAAEGRKFGLTVGLAFGFIGLLLFWRGRVTRAEVVLAVSAALVLAAFVAPTRLGPIQRGWMGLAHLISKVTTPVFMGIVYFVVLMPIGIVRRLTGGSPIWKKERASSRWEPHVRAADARERMEHQF